MNFNYTSVPQPSTTASILSATTTTALVLKHGMKNNKFGRKFTTKLLQNASYYLPRFTKNHSKQSTFTPSSTTFTPNFTSLLQQPSRSYSTNISPSTIQSTTNPIKSTSKHRFNRRLQALSTQSTSTPNQSSFQSTSQFPQPQQRSFSTQNVSNQVSSSSATTTTTTTAHQPTRSFYHKLALPTGILASSTLYITIIDDNGQVENSDQIELPPNMRLKFHPVVGDYDDHVIDVLGPDGTVFGTTTFKQHVSLDTLRPLSESSILSSATSSSSAVSATDIEYAQSQLSSSTSQTSTDNNNNHNKQSTSSTQHQHNQPPSQRSTTTSQSSHSSSKSTTSQTDNESTTNTSTKQHDSLPKIIGAPPAQFAHPYDTKYSGFYKFIYGLKRFCVIVWTFIPFIRHWVVTHHFRAPTPKDRADMLNNLSKCIEQSGCAFIKFGQWLSMRPDIFPQDVIEVLSRLRDGAPAHEFDETRAIIQEEFGRDINELFLTFNSKPVASGSIAQVYKAKLRPERAIEMNIRDADGNLVDEVAVKIRHPGVLAETWIDLDIIYFIVDRVPGLCIPFNKEELKLMIQYQIDFRFEGHYLSRFRRNFAEEIKQGFLAFPYVSTNSLRQAVLIESWAGGQTVGEIFEEVGDLFKPIIRKLDGGKPKPEKTLLQELQTKILAGMIVARGFSIDLVYKLADKFQIKVDTYNAITNSNYDSIDNTFIANFLRDILPPRSRIGEERYKWNPALSDEENLAAEQKKILAYTLFDMFIKMFLRDNLIHADLHAGNVLYDNKSFKHTATVLDAGMTVALESDIMRQFGLFLRAICDGDQNSLVEACSRFEVNLPNAETLAILPGLPNDSSDQWARLPVPNGSGIGLLATNFTVRNAFHHDINDIFTRFYSKSKVWGTSVDLSENVSIGDVVGQVLLAMQTHGIILRGDVAASIMAMSVIEGLLRQLDPDLDIVVNALPYFLRYKNLETVLLR